MDFRKYYFYRICSKYAKIFIKLLNSIYYYIVYRNNFILINCWVEQWFGILSQRNFGDELNVYLIEELTGKKVVNAQNTLFKKKSISAIGSIVEYYSLSTIIWGSGAIEGSPRELRGKPIKVHAVRGKLTRKYLLENNVDCPSVFGDPALLLPYVYNPLILKKYKYGFIPHYTQLDNPIIKKFLSKYKDEILLISFKDYGDWHNVIKQIKSCESIISASLHGLIISDAYGIPNVWIKVSGLIGDEFKFKDYFSGVKRDYIPPFSFNEESTLSDISKSLKSYKAVVYDIEALIKTCPFTINTKKTLFTESHNFSSNE